MTDLLAAIPYVLAFLEFPLPLSPSFARVISSVVMAISATKDKIAVSLRGKTDAVQTGYFIGKECIGCKLCYSVCPQKCIDISSVPVNINQNHCLHCGRCAEICPKQCIEKRG